MRLRSVLDLSVDQFNLAMNFGIPKYSLTI